MNQLLILAALAFPAGALGILFKVAIACVIIWAIYALLQWAGIAIPRPIQIVFIALACILVIYWLFELFGVLS